MDILNFHRNVIAEIIGLRKDVQVLQQEQCETNNLLRALVQLASPQYKLTVDFRTQEQNSMATTPTPTDNTQIGQITVGFPAETETNPNTGVTTPYAFKPASIQWTLVDPTIASFTVDATTGEATFTALAAGSTTGTATDSDTKATVTFDLVVVPAAQPDTFALTVTFQPK